MSKKKICFVAQFLPPIHGLSKAVDTLYNSELLLNYEFEKVNLTNNKKFLGNLLLIQRSNADLFYFTISQTRGGNLRDLIILKLIELKHKKCLIHLHGGYYRKLVDNDLPSLQRTANYQAISKLAGVIVLGKSLKHIFEGMLPEEKIFIVPNCVDDEYLMSEGEFIDKVDTLSQRKIKRILYLSNFIKSKGYPEVLELARMEKIRSQIDENRKFHFDFAGKFFDKKEEEYFYSFIKKHELDDFVTYYGIVSGEGKREILKKADIFALLTYYPNEGQPISILEAMGNGMFIVSTNYAGIPDIVSDNINAKLVDPRKFEISDLYETLVLLDDNDLKKYEITNRKTVQEHYLQKDFINKMDKIFFLI